MDVGDLDIAGALAARASAANSTDSLARSLRGASSQEAAAKFEALFASMLVKEMRKALPEGFFGEGAGGDIYGGWFDEHLGAAIARTGDLHLKPLVESGMKHDAAARAYADALATSAASLVDETGTHGIDAGLSSTDANSRSQDTQPGSTDAISRSTGESVRSTGATVAEALRALHVRAPESLRGVRSIDAGNRSMDANLRTTNATRLSTEEPR